MEYRNEQIIVDDCKVEECVNFRDEVSIDSTVLKNACSIGLWQRHYKNLQESCKMSCKCDENPNCYFKQLARKTQECEELWVAYNKAQDILGRIDVANELKSYSLQKSIKECDRYHKALEAIEKKCCAVLNGDEKILYAYKIKEIINKAKDSK